VKTMDELFSPTEMKILKILGRRKMKIGEIAEKLYGKKKLNTNTIVTQLVRRINNKCEYHKLSWFINGKGAGRGGKTVWKDKL
jgi:DNA-binding response OmpR family regulator